MKAPIIWINDYTKVLGLDVKEIADKMTLSGSKVEGIEITGNEITNVITGKIIDIEKHPDADKLVICKIDIGDKILQIVTGANNIKVSDIVPVALDGATLANNIKIKTGKLRGVVSEGMLCSIQELGYTKDDFLDASADGIYILPSNTAINQNILDVLGLGEAIIDFEITSNRPDCFSIEGLAREVAVTLDLPFSPVVPKKSGVEGFYVKDLITVENKEPEKCLRYIARAVKNVKIGPSPKWMVSKLRDAGVRSINNIVDITNYVMIELGQPMHAFDYNDLHEKSIVIRNAYANEKMTTLDCVVRSLDESMLVIADSNKAVAMAGIMGSENSEIKETTNTIIFESANFEGINVRLTAKKLGMRTESSSRFEKGLDPINAKRALDRACELVELLECGEVSIDEIDIFPGKIEKTKLLFRPSKINDFLGTEISEKQMVEILKKLEINFVKSNDQMFCEIPSFRPDLQEEVDIAEEVARFYGYNNITPTMLIGKSTTLGGLNHYQKQKLNITQVMLSNGFYEACTYSFTSPKIFDKLCMNKDDALRNAIVISNPLGEDFSVMRTTMLGNLVEIASTNWNRGVDLIKIFEIAKVYLPNPDKSQVMPLEKDTLGSVFYVKNDNYETSESFYTMKGIIENLAYQIGVKKLKFSACKDHSSFHPGRTAKIYDGNNEIGVIGYIHPDVAQNMGAPKETVVFMLDIASLVLNSNAKRKFKALPKFPSMTRDIALIMDIGTPISDVLDIILENGGNRLESVKLFDVYTGKQISDNKKSVAYQLVFRSNEGTLTDDVVNTDLSNLLSALKEKTGAQLR